MSALSVRLEKAAARIPPIQVPTTDRPQIDFKEICANLSAETARAAALPPAERLAHILNEIERAKRKAVEPIEADGSVRASLAGVMRKVLATDIKKGFPFRQYEIRACELQILREHGYDVSTLEREHRAFSHINWQFHHYKTPLPPDAQALIDHALFAI